jgi:hypothetical protein
MSYAVVYAVAFLASGLTFFSGFGLGTLLLPAFALFLPIQHAVALTAVVHFLNGLFKLALVGRHADVRVLLRFAVPAMVASFIGAALLVRLSGVPPLVTYSILGHTAEVTPLKLIVGVLLFVFALADVRGRPVQGGVHRHRCCGGGAHRHLALDGLRARPHHGGGRHRLRAAGRRSVGGFRGGLSREAAVQTEEGAIAHVRCLRSGDHAGDAVVSHVASLQFARR